MLQGTSHSIQSFEERWENLINALETGALNNSEITNLILKVDELAAENQGKIEKLVNSERVQILLKYAKQSELLKNAVSKWFKIATDVAIPELTDEDDFVIVPTGEKEYIRADNQTIKTILQHEFDQQAVGDAKATYAWKYKSGQDKIASGQDDANQMNIFFLGTSTPPLFGKHNIDICETGHIISQASLQKGLKSEPSLLVKGIATIDMQPDFPLNALDNPNIQGVSSGGWVETFRKTKTTVKGAGVEHRLELTMDDYFVPNLLKMVLNRPLESRGEITINLAGHSRGGITTFVMADCANQFIQTLANGQEGKDYNLDDLAQSTHMEKEDIRTAITNIKGNTDKIKIKICALDPVEGARSMSGWDPLGAYIPDISVEVKGITKPIKCSYVEMPPSVKEATVFFAADERRSGFRPTIPVFSAQTQVNFIRVPGKHGTLTGNYGNDGNMGQFQYSASKDDQEFQDALLGIFDETLLAINKKLNNINELPPFPLNTFRRIIRQPEYENTKNLLLQSLLFKDGSLEFGKLKEDDLISMMYKSMVENSQDNIIFYDCLSRDAQAALENHKEKLRLLEKDWRHDTNVGERVDRDAWQEDRTVYIRGKKVFGVVSWHESKLEQLAPIYLPNTMYYGQSEPCVIREFKNKFDDDMVIRFYQLKNKIDSVAHTPNLLKEDAKRAIFDDEFIEFAKMLPQVTNQNLLKNMVAELMIDLDYKYHLVDSHDFANKLKLANSKNQFDEFPKFCLKVQSDALQKYLQKNGFLSLSLDETLKLSEHVNELALRAPSENLDLLSEQLQLKAELDQYIKELEAYMELKPTITGQQTDKVKNLKDDLLAIRLGLREKSPVEVRDSMHNTLDNYVSEKKFQGYISAWIKPAPGSVVCIHTVTHEIHTAKVRQEMKRLHALNQTEWVKEDLQKYIHELDLYIQSYKWRSPDARTVKLLEDLRALDSHFDSNSIEKTEREMNALVNGYIEDKELTVYKTKSTSVQKLIEIKEQISKSRHEMSHLSMLERTKGPLRITAYG
ncbi:MAG: hypothetical protein HYX61_02715 [Gammaproteobacteria bacterium]|jgi:hypothetical protein|nr:hypothetical protein [Gammaproteobacteria bacterium]